MRTNLREKRGSAALIAVSMVVLLGIGALAVDLGMLMKVRAEAQRAADAAALAGAGAFATYSPAEATDSAFNWVMRWAALNQMQATPVDTLGGAGRSGLFDQRNEITMQVIPDSAKVRVWVRRGNIGLFLARVLGFRTWEVNAKAAAEAALAGRAEECVKPFLIPDYWDERTGEDLAPANRIWDLPTAPPQGQFRCGEGGVECWDFDGTRDGYHSFQEEGVADTLWSGLGTDWRNNSYQNGYRYHKDYGRPIIMYPDSPQLSPTPSNFYLWRIACPGGDCLREAMNECHELTAEVGELIAAEQPGAVNGPLAQGLADWMNQDPSAVWVEGTPDGSNYVRGTVESSQPGMDGLANPRVFTAAIMRPEFLNPGYDAVPVLNLARFFLESGPTSASDKRPIVVRFMGFASGVGPENPDLGTLVRLPRLVE